MPLRDALRQVARTAHLMVGVADYEVYAAHRAADHPGEPLMSRIEFHRERMERRFGGADGMSRCC